MSALDIISALAANRKAYFELVAALERDAQCAIDCIDLAGIIDSKYPGRARLTNEEAQDVLMLVARQRFKQTDDDADSEGGQPT